jgi:hypothetical protein
MQTKGDVTTANSSGAAKGMTHRTVVDGPPEALGRYFQFRKSTPNCAGSGNTRVCVGGAKALSTQHAYK